MNRILIKTAFILITALVFSTTISAQKYVCTSGQTSFFSETPMENISALNKKVVSIIDASNSTIAVKMTMTDFSFTNRLMEEHFNENYIESEKYPTSVFSGKIVESVDFTKDGKYNVTGTGSLVIHGTKKERNFKGILTIKGDNVTLTSEYLIKPESFKIEIPSLVVTKIAEEISVRSSFTYSKSSK